MCYSAAAAGGYCCSCRLLLLLQSKYRNLLLPIHAVMRCCEYLRHTAAAQIAYKITHSRSIQVELGKVEGFRGTLRQHCTLLNWMLTSHLNVATWTNQLVLSSSVFWLHLNVRLSWTFFDFHFIDLVSQMLIFFSSISPNFDYTKSYFENCQFSTSPSFINPFGNKHLRNTRL